MDALNEHYNYVQYLQYKYEKFKDIDVVKDQRAKKITIDNWPKPVKKKKSMFLKFLKSMFNN